ncbi:hypothetical protein GN330_12025 [Nitratireductor sp. CAU 1489]|uniref:Uncharacterized protein n=1 Tax=Nitratireductor arenosus TaxID=2682096 RepID=A0A844QF47_9HYPH|nr:hypothetical protein [Nitratireductor arenosus]MVA97972.1 hypothetical protein [Nitratireductor arenosus]
MSKTSKTQQDKDLAGARQRRLVAAHLQAIEDSPPTAEQTAMFEMFEREGWSHQKRRACIKARTEAATVVHAAE